jgi:hypothetical protein
MSYRRRDGVVRKVGKAAAVALMTPLTAAAIAVGFSGSASAAELCPPLGSASITPPSGTITEGSTVHVSATVKGILSAHLQISGPGLGDQQVETRRAADVIQGDVTVPEPGYFTLTVIGDITKCRYDTSGFSVSARPSPTSSPTHHRPPSKSPEPGGRATVPGSTTNPSGGRAPGGYIDLGSGGVPTAQPLNNDSPFSLPSLVPGGPGIGFQYPTPDPQIAAPAATQVRADDASTTSPVKWGQSIAAALVLLLLSAHFGMWSRRQRLAAEARAAQAGSGARSPRGPGDGKAPYPAQPTTTRRRRRPPVTEPVSAGTGPSDAAENGRSTASDGAEGGGSTASGAEAPDAAAGKVAGQSPAAAAGTAEAAPARRGYRGRRRRRT